MKKYKALLAGAGSMGRAWARNLAACDRAVLAGWVDWRPEAAEQAVVELGLSAVETFQDIEAGLAAVKPDFVVDVTSPESHHAITLASLAAGIPVLGEKPMAISMEQAREMVAASERSGKLYMVSQSRRYDPRIRAFRKLVAKHVGPPGILNSDFYIGAHFGGFRDEMDSPLLLDMAIHTFDAARFISDCDPVAVYCDEFNPSWSWYAGNACATAVFEMTGGLRYTYRGSWCSEGLHTAWEAEWRAVGPRGTAAWDGAEGVRAEAVMAPGGFFSEFRKLEPENEEPVKPGIEGSLEEFLNALETGATPLGECHDNIKSLAMVFGAIESAARRQRVEIGL